MIEALRGPNWLGVKVTFSVQLAPAPRLEPQVLFWSKFVALVPVIPTLLITSSAPPVLVSVSTCGLLSVPTTNTPKLKLVGARIRVGGVGGGDQPPQPLSKYNPPNTIAKRFFTVCLPRVKRLLTDRKIKMLYLRSGFLVSPRRSIWRRL